MRADDATASALAAIHAIERRRNIAAHFHGQGRNNRCTDGLQYANEQLNMQMSCKSTEEEKEAKKNTCKSGVMSLATLSRGRHNSIDRVN